jgi:hypothetical protein
VTDDTLPTKPGDWVAQKGNHSRIAKVKSVSRFGDEVLVDLVLYDHRNGDRIGRESPPEGGPRTFEPACDFQYWERIAEPTFPIPLKWGQVRPDGSRVADWSAGPALPNLHWKPRARRRSGMIKDRTFEDVVRQIAAGHNDPMNLARSALAKR